MARSEKSRKISSVTRSEKGSSGLNVDMSLEVYKMYELSTVEPLLYDHPQNHIGVVV